MLQSSKGWSAVGVVGGGDEFRCIGYQQSRERILVEPGIKSATSSFSSPSLVTELRVNTIPNSNHSVAIGFGNTVGRWKSTDASNLFPQGSFFLFVAFIKDSDTMSSIRHFKHYVTYFAQNRISGSIAPKYVINPLPQDKF